jgi:hypothetical protein
MIFAVVVMLALAWCQRELCCPATGCIASTPNFVLALVGVRLDVDWAAHLSKSYGASPFEGVHTHVVWPQRTPNCFESCTALAVLGPEGPLADAEKLNLLQQLLCGVCLPACLCWRLLCLSVADV